MVGVSFSEAADPLGSVLGTVSRVVEMLYCTGGGASSEQQFCRQKCHVDERGQRRMSRQVEADIKATVTQISTL